MVNTVVQGRVARSHALLWVDLTFDTTDLLSNSFDNALEMCRISDPLHVIGAIQTHAPVLVCFEFDFCNVVGLESLARVRHELPALPVLVIVGPNSMEVATWALRLRVWDLLIKPVAHEEVHRRIVEVVFPSRICEAGLGENGCYGSTPVSFANFVARRGTRQRTSAAVSYVAENYGKKITLETVAALCRLSPSQFCRAFRKEQSASFGDYLIRYRMQRARERLVMPGSLVKEVAYTVGYNDLSYFSRCFREIFGMCPSAYQAWARSSHQIAG